MRKATFHHFSKGSAWGDGAIAEPTWVGAWLHKPEFEVHEQHWVAVAVLVEPKIQQHVLQALAGQVFLQNTADRLLNLRRYRMVEIALVGAGRHGGWPTRA